MRYSSMTICSVLLSAKGAHPLLLPVRWLYGNFNFGSSTCEKANILSMLKCPAKPEIPSQCLFSMFTRSFSSSS